MHGVDEFGEVFAGGKAIDLEAVCGFEILQIGPGGLDFAQSDSRGGGGHFGFQNFEIGEGECLPEVGGLFPDCLVEVVGELEMVGISARYS